MIAYSAYRERGGDISRFLEVITRSKLRMKNNRACRGVNLETGPNECQTPRLNGFNFSNTTAFPVFLFSDLITLSLIPSNNFRKNEVRVASGYPHFPHSPRKISFDSIYLLVLHKKRSGEKWRRGRFPISLSLFLAADQTHRQLPTVLTEHY